MKRLVLIAIALFRRAPRQRAGLDLWPQGKVAFGVYAPSEAARGTPPVYTPEGAAKVAANPLYDYVFLNLEGAYDAGGRQGVRRGPQEGASRKTLIVRIPPISKDGAEATGRA